MYLRDSVEAYHVLFGVAAGCVVIRLVRLRAEDGHHVRLRICLMKQRK